MSTSHNRARTVISIIDDDLAVRESLGLNLRAAGYETIFANDGLSGLRLIEDAKPDLIILDVIMPVKDGLQACKELRSVGVSTPIILLTHRSSSIDKVLGLDLGADDYIGKPFEVNELLARVRALLRRSTEISSSDMISFADVAVDFKAYRALRNGVPLSLSAREFRLLQYLVKKQGMVVSRDELLDKVWGYASYPSTRTVDNHVARLRQKIEYNCEDPKHIITVHGVGYKFVA
jgi:DNA-binding response OmpR family regulator